MFINYPAARFFTKNMIPRNLEAFFTEKGSKSIALLVARKGALWKRLIDITGALLGLFFLLPFYMVIACYIKMVSPGPVLFKQTRIGYGGIPFNCLKFRTMKPNADSKNHRKYLAKLINGNPEQHQASSAMTKLHDDPQIIPFGNLLRETGLDELPQLLNVLRGEMSLVGPRPPIPYEVEEYKPWYTDRFDVLPGLTGLWQVSGKNRMSFNEMIRLDIQYVRKSSLLLDLKIILLTPYALGIQVTDFLAKKKQRAHMPSPLQPS